VGLGGYVAWRAYRCDPKFFVIRQAGGAVGSWGGTRFYRADLTDATFAGAHLRGTNFRHATIPRVCWKNTTRSIFARWGGTILFNDVVRNLLITGQGKKQNFAKADLRGAYLNHANLEGADLRFADLSEATLQQANLAQANLTETLAINTDFSHATLTGACLQAWNIDHSTNLTGVDCQYVYLLEKPNALGSRERRPHDPTTVFADGDFEQLYQKTINVVQILLRNGINREAFAEAFANLMDENPEITPDSIQAIEKKGNDVLVSLEVPETADKAKIERDFLKPYEAKIRELEATVQTKRQMLQDRDAVILDYKTFLSKALDRPINVENINTNQATGAGNSMSEVNDNRQDNRQTISSGGDININATHSVVNLRDLNGQVTNTINQLPPSAETDQLKPLLEQLQAAIMADPAVPDSDKGDALAEVETIANAAEEPEPEKKKSIVKRATRMLKGIASSLPDATQFVTAVTELVPAIAGVFAL